MNDAPSALPVSRSRVPLLARALELGLLRPMKRAQAILGARAWAPVEAAAAVGGALAGALLRPWLARDGSVLHPAMPVLRLTDAVERRLGIRGVNVLESETTAVRHVHDCPFAATLRHGGERFCTGPGFLAGREAFRRIVPGCEFVVEQTMAQGHAQCRYTYRVPSPAEPPEA